jgi:hypothetical protein
VLCLGAGLLSLLTGDVDVAVVDFDVVVGVATKQKKK